ncbi:uncharacterized protein cubi_02109 [Cryptosporidium ubiquitum]|uniref:LNR domain-containing protein n=1 Tax=Cryptosporidium ubiquitum TaxID=857276 RepID=A0A1J4MRG9_9CRYT|nr:uncharacterized protein cubi_02109 [Cryptosporidium ubiquitum]OII75588.1 hypothetical protein cubi_02109 [Cryptosporidium ubiquitum]
MNKIKLLIYILKIFQVLLEIIEGAVKKVPIVSSSGLVCEDNPSVAESGYSCSFLARRFGGFLGCEKLLKDLAQDSLPPGIPGSTRVVDACPNSCNKCRECSPGCALWFIGNGVCDPECDNLSCQFDGGDCWKVDCKLSAWSSWSTCSVTCGPGGRVTRTRQIVVSPRNGGESCGALKAEETGCNSHIPCPLSCTVSEWGSWSRCSSTCGIGHQMRERSVIKAPKDQNLFQCPETRQIRECIQDTCSSNCTLGDFKFKSAVSGTPCLMEQGCVERREILYPPFKPELGNFTCIMEERPSDCSGLHLNCPGLCSFSEWSGWSLCSYYKNEGLGFEGEVSKYKLLKKRRRIARKRMRDAKCEDELEFKECDESERQGVEALVRCNMGDWSSWSSCSTSCGLGSRLRARWLLSEPENEEVLSENLINTESVCGPLFQTKACNDRSCLTEVCKVSDWTQWSPCSSKTCNSPGLSKRHRSIISLPRKGDCPVLEESRDCLGVCDHSVSVSKSNCMFGDWSSWSSCQDDCYTKYNNKGTTERSEKERPKRYRHKMIIFNPKDKDCSKENDYIEVKDCEGGCESANVEICQVTQWGSWSSCSANCDGGSRRRIRERVNSGRGIVKAGSRPLTRGISSSCPSLLEVEKCNTHPCEYSCELSPWYSKTRKSIGTQDRRGSRGDGVVDEENNEDLVISDCSTKCGIGYIERSRKILSGGFVISSNEEQNQYTSKVCGPLKDTIKCVRISEGCNVDCQVGEWSSWSVCSTSCGEGFQSRSRELLVPSLGKKCELATEELRECFEGPCPSSCRVSPWSEWTTCLGGCDEKPYKRRERKILEPPASGQSCPVLEETLDANEECPRSEKCPSDCKVGEWSSWSECDAKCGIGVEKRVRKVLRRESKGGAPCPNLEDLRPCSREACKSDCVLGEWGDWGVCSKSCGGGSRSRVREVISQPSQGKECDFLKDFEPCNEFQCIATRDCEVGQWSVWSPCSASCGGGVKRRQREIQVPATGGGRCEFELNQKVGCNGFKCPGEPCIDRPEAQEVVPCSILKAMFGCQKRLIDVAKSNGVPYPDDRPPEARIMDGCPATCGMCSECAPGCQLRDVGNLNCDPACNNVACRFDDGDCEKNSSHKASCILPKLSEAFLFLSKREYQGKKSGNDFLEIGASSQSTIESQNTVKDSSDNSLIVLENNTSQFGLNNLSGMVEDGFTGNQVQSQEMEFSHEEYNERHGTDGSNTIREYKKGDIVYIRCDQGKRFRKYTAIPYFKYQCKESGFIQLIEPKGTPLLYVDGDGIPRIPTCEEDECPYLMVQEAPQMIGTVNTLYKRDLKHSYTYIMYRDIGEPIFITGDHQRIILGPVGTLYLISIDSFYPEFGDPSFEKYRLWSLVDISQQKIIQEFVELRLVCVKDPNSLNSNVMSSNSSTDSEIVKASFNRPLRFLSQVSSSRSNLGSQVVNYKAHVETENYGRSLQEKPYTYVMGKKRFCEDQPEVKEQGILCETLSMMCDINIPNPQNYGLPENSFVWQVCPSTCDKCGECSPGCPEWFKGNTVCDKACNNQACNFDDGDCEGVINGQDEEKHSEDNKLDERNRNDGKDHTEYNDYDQKNTNKDNKDSIDLQNNVVIPEGAITYFAGKFRNCTDIPELIDSLASCKALKQTCHLKLPLSASSLEAGLSHSSTISQVCPKTCGICEECAPGCPKWFINNGYCDVSCQNPECQFDGGDCSDENITSKPKLPIKNPNDSKNSPISTSNQYTNSSSNKNNNSEKSCIDHPIIFEVFKRSCEELKTSFGCSITLEKIFQSRDQLPDKIKPGTKLRDLCKLTCKNCSNRKDENRNSNNGRREQTGSNLENKAERPYTIVFNERRYCEDQPEVAKKGISCKNLSSMCNASIPGAKTYGLPDGTPIWRVCPSTCNKCGECSPGCPEWFKGNTVCDKACNNQACNFDDGDCKGVRNEEDEEKKILNKDDDISNSEKEYEIDSRGKIINGKNSDRDNKDKESDLDRKFFSMLKEKGQKCRDDPQVEELSGFSCEQITSIFDCSTLLKDLPGSSIPDDVPKDTLLKHACAESCGLCEAFSNDKKSTGKEREEKEHQENKICKDDVYISFVTGRCRDIMNFSINISEVCNESLSERTVLRDNRKSSTFSMNRKVYEHCPKSCGRCRSECEDDSKLLPGECRIAIETASIQGYGCDMPLLQVSFSLAERFGDEKEYLLLSDVCARSCNYCSQSQGLGTDSLLDNRSSESFCSIKSTKNWGNGYLLELKPSNTKDEGSGPKTGVFPENMEKKEDVRSLLGGSKLIVSCNSGYSSSDKQDSVEAICDIKSSVYILPETFKCEEPHVEVMQVELEINEASDFDFTAVSSIYTALYSTLPVYQPNGLRIEAISTTRFENILGDGQQTIKCEDQNHQLKSFGINCSMLKPFCSKTLEELAKQFNRSIPDGVSADIKVSIACPITCDNCKEFLEVLNNLRNEENEEQDQDDEEKRDSERVETQVDNAERRRKSQKKDQGGISEEILGRRNSDLGSLYVLFNVGFFLSSSRGRESSFEAALKDRAISKRFVTTLKTQFASRGIRLAPKEFDIRSWDSQQAIVSNSKLASEDTADRKMKSRFKRHRMIRILKSDWDKFYSGQKGVGMDEEARNLFYTSGISMPFIRSSRFGTKEAVFLKRPLKYLQNAYLKCGGKGIFSNSPISMSSSTNQFSYSVKNRNSGYVEQDNSCCGLPQDFRTILISEGCGSLIYDRIPDKIQMDLFCRGTSLARNSCFLRLQEVINRYKNRRGTLCNTVEFAQQLLDSWCYMSPSNNTSKSLEKENGTESSETDLDYQVGLISNSNSESISDSGSGLELNQSYNSGGKKESQSRGLSRGNNSKKETNGDYCFSSIKETISVGMDSQEFVSATFDTFKSRCHPDSCFRNHLRYFDAITQLHTAWGYPLPSSPLKKSDFGTGTSSSISGNKSTSFSRSNTGNIETEGVTGSSTNSNTYSNLEVLLEESNEGWLDLLCTSTSTGTHCQESLSILLERNPIKSKTLLLNPCHSKCFMIVAGRIGSSLQRFGQLASDPQSESLGLLLRHYSRHFCVKNSKGQSCGPLLFAGASFALEASLSHKQNMAKEAQADKIKNTNISKENRSSVSGFGLENQKLREEEINNSDEDWNRNLEKKPYLVGGMDRDGSMIGFQTHKLENYCNSGCFSYYVGDGMCDLQCFNEACSWDKGDCQSSSMYPEIYQPLEDLFKGCLAGSSSKTGGVKQGGTCSTTCRARYSILAETLGCCTSVAVDLYQSLTQLLDEQPQGGFLKPGESFSSSLNSMWSISRLEQMCGMSLDRTCSDGLPRILTRMTLALDHPDSGLAEDPQTPLAVSKVVSRSLGILDSDITKVFFTNNTPYSQTNPKDFKFLVDIVIDTGSTELIDLDDKLLLEGQIDKLQRRWGLEFCYELGDSHGEECRVRLVEVVSEPTSSLGISNSTAPALPWMNSIGFSYLNKDLPSEPCSMNHQYLQDASRYKLISISGQSSSSGAGYTSSPGYGVTNNHKSMSHGSKFSISCSNNHYSPSSGRSPDTLTCNNGRWETSSGLRCNRKCLSFSELPTGLKFKENSGVFGSKKEQDQMVNHGFKVQVECFSDDYRSTSAIIEDTIQCMDGVWTAPVLECRKSCTNLSSKSLGSSSTVVGREYRHNDQRMVFCSDDHYLSPKSGKSVIPSRSRSSKDKKETKKKDQLVNESNSLILEEELHISKSYKGISTLDEAIGRGYYLLTCNNGTWESEPLICVKGTLTDYSKIKKGIEVTMTHIFSIKTLIACLVIISTIFIIIIGIWLAWIFRYRRQTEIHDMDQFERVENARRVLLQLSGVGYTENISYDQTTENSNINLQGQNEFSNRISSPPSSSWESLNNLIDQGNCRNLTQKAT